MKPVIATTNGGMSRAAKKRAKKKQKQSNGLEMAIPTMKTVPMRMTTESTSKSTSSIMPTKRPVAQEQHAKPTKKVRVDPRAMGDHRDEDKPTKKVRKPVAKAPTEAVPTPLACETLAEIVDAKASFADATSKERANAALEFLIAPSGLTLADFYGKYWEKQPVAIKDDTKEHRRRLDGFLSLDSIKQMMDANTMYYGRDLNVTRYETNHKDGTKHRVTLDLVKAKKNSDDSDDLEDNFVRVDPEIAWSHYNQGCTIRLLCPHQHDDAVHSLLSLLEVEWGCMVGANAYLTPAGQSQGFAPHYDDIEAFCLQLQGRKRWKVYEPLNKAERLPRASSKDYTEEDLRGVEPAMDIILEPGDILYMPRGWIHQACTLPDGVKEDGHSLHLTVSAMQQWAWADLMETLLPEALAAATAGDSTLLRSGLPRNFLDYTGAMHDNREEDVPEVLKRQGEIVSDDPDELKAASVRRLQDEFRTEAKKRIMKVAKEAMEIIDATCDEMGKRFLSDRLPPAWSAKERSETSQGRSEGVPMQSDTLCRLARPGIARLVLEDEKAVLYHCADNSRVYQEHSLSPMEFEMDDAPALEQLLTTNEPDWVMVQDLIHDTLDDKIGVAQALFDEGVLAIRSAVDQAEDEEQEDDDAAQGDEEEESSE